jgi:hypothetical protein
LAIFGDLLYNQLKTFFDENALRKKTITSNICKYACSVQAIKPLKKVHQSSPYIRVVVFEGLYNEPDMAIARDEKH